MTLVFSPARFDALLGVARPGLGQNVSWQSATSCPCRNPTSGAAKQGCPTCAGKGVFWGSPVAAWTGLAGMKVAREWAMYSEWASGDVVITIGSDSPLWNIGETDKVSFVDSSQPFSTVLMGGVDKLSFQAAVINGVIWLDPITQLPITGGIPTQDAGGNLTWASGAPPTLTQYTISGRRIPDYYCFRDLAQDRAHSAGLPLPRRVILRLFDLFGR